MTLLKYINTKHPVNINATKRNTSTKAHESACKEESEIVLSLEDDELENWFQIEIIDNEDVHVCNLCDVRFDYDNKVKEHMKSVYKEDIESMLTESYKGCKEEEFKES